MKKSYAIIIFLISFITSAQNVKTSNTLEVVGFAKVAITPDIGILNINITNIDSLFSQSINGLNQKSTAISDQLSEIGFQRSSIRTNNFEVHKNTVYRDNKNVDSGYIASQQIQLEFKNDKDNISRILKQFSGSRSQVDLNFNFKLSDTLKRSVQKEIIKLATKDAFDKAKLISEASEIEKGQVVKINYGNNFNGGMRLYNNDQGLNEIVIRGKSDLSNGFTPSDVVYTDNILVTWDLK
ncbi:SIMPL domain-containing protein [Gramella sp. MT6]|uniref:SIMPL domain-containing protein n=1 Tax=Gramella sp. MT6 TaxID=2705471 RepID=UPI001C5DFA1C|nr:SIMPL domain-containing protein [Gramella sp. MT6]QYA26938.1 SIMPL domain-containing protein [Gramella sp. MT6]